MKTSQVVVLAGHKLVCHAGRQAVTQPSRRLLRIHEDRFIVSFLLVVAREKTKRMNRLNAGELL